MARVNDFSSRYRVIEVRSQEQLEGLLEQIWPTKAIPADELFERFGSPVDEAIIKSDLGYPRKWYTPAELSAYFWMRSNYHAQDEKDRYSDDE
ncbi:hypothetical protein [Vibrio sp. OPT18]|uniref:hypothetical protein n=1 Tax=Vibrio sp. OPT18 TaxID=2778641 RepID=UPI001880E9DD|nr:hypothetical protein [Vibrio sp. OPT18]MBE8578629.1 hypothetical protein [Vibrio sp. OPT18]